MLLHSPFVLTLTDLLLLVVMGEKVGLFVSLSAVHGVHGAHGVLLGWGYLAKDEVPSVFQQGFSCKEGTREREGTSQRVCIANPNANLNQAAEKS